jgi:hypothetical protein
VDWSLKASDGLLAIFISARNLGVLQTLSSMVLNLAPSPVVSTSLTRMWCMCHAPIMPILLIGAESGTSRRENILEYAFSVGGGPLSKATAGLG